MLSSPMLDHIDRWSDQCFWPLSYSGLCLAFPCALFKRSCVASPLCLWCICQQPRKGLTQLSEPVDQLLVKLSVLEALVEDVNHIFSRIWEMSVLVSHHYLMQLQRFSSCLCITYSRSYCVFSYSQVIPKLVIKTCFRSSQESTMLAEMLDNHLWMLAPRHMGK